MTKKVSKYPALTSAIKGRAVLLGFVFPSCLTEQDNPSVQTGGGHHLETNSQAKSRTPQKNIEDRKHLASYQPLGKTTNIDGSLFADTRGCFTVS